MIDIKKIIDDAISSSEDTKYCIDCKFSYIQDNTGTGFCKYGKLMMYPKPISEFNSCKHWKKK